MEERFARAPWTALHPGAPALDGVLVTFDAETVHLRGFGDTAIPVAGPGAPLVAEFSVAEFAAAIGQPTEAGHDALKPAITPLIREYVAAELPP